MASSEANTLAKDLSNNVLAFKNETCSFLQRDKEHQSNIPGKRASSKDPVQIDLPLLSFS